MFDTIDWGDYRARVKLGIFKKTFRMTCQLCARFSWVNGFRIIWYRAMGIKVGKGVFVGLDCFIDSDFSELITIEDGVSISFRVTIISHDWSRRKVAPVLIKKDTIIGTGAIVLPGITVGEKALVAAGAVVSRDVPEGATVIGNPASPVWFKKPSDAEAP